MRKPLTIVVVLLALVAFSILPVSASGPPNPGTGKADFYVMNVDDTVGDKLVTVNYYGQDGTTDASENVNVPSHGTKKFASGTLPVGDGWVGSVVISAEAEVATVTNLLWTGGQWGDGKTGGAYSGVSQPSTTLYLPYVTRVTDLRFSIITVQNAGVGDAAIQINYFNTAGTLVAGPLNDTIGEGRSKSYDLSTPNGTTVPNLVSPFQGAAYITSSKPLAGAVTSFWKDYSTAYEGFGGGSSPQYLPSIYRVVTGGTDWKRHSNILVQNLSTTTTANVDVDFYITGNATAVLHLDDTIPPKSMHEYNTHFGGLIFPASTFNVLGNTFNGSAVVTADQPIVAVSHSFWTSLISASTYNGIPGGIQKVYMPWSPRIKTAGVFTQWSKVIIQNLDAAAATIDLYYYNPTTGAQVAHFTDTIAGRSADGYNTQYGSDGWTASGGVTGISPTAFNVLGDTFEGGVQITSNKPIVAVMNILQNDWINTYNGYSPAP